MVLPLFYWEADMAHITISEGLGWLKTLRARHAELIQLRNANGSKVTVDYNNRQSTTVPEYDAVKLDEMIAALARDIRLCETGIKRTNAKTHIEGYDYNDAILGELKEPRRA